MHNPSAKLVENLFDAKIAQAPTRDGFGKGTIEAGKKDQRVVVLCADLAESTRAEWFEKEFVDRFIEVGVAEQNLAALGSGFAAGGKIPFIASYAAFSPGRNYEQIRTTIALNQQNVKICGMHAGVSVGPDGATHQMLEDIGLMRILPHMIVLNPCDAEEARKSVIAAALHDGPVYIRFGREAVPVFTTSETPFAIGKAQIYYENPDEGESGSKVAHTRDRASGLRGAQGRGGAREGGHPRNCRECCHHQAARRRHHLSIARATGRIITVEEHQTAVDSAVRSPNCLQKNYRPASSASASAISSVSPAHPPSSSSTTVSILRQS